MKSFAKSLPSRRRKERERRHREHHSSPIDGGCRTSSAAFASSAAPPDVATTRDSTELRDRADENNYHHHYDDDDDDDDDDYYDGRGGRDRASRPTRVSLGDDVERRRRRRGRHEADDDGNENATAGGAGAAEAAARENAEEEEEEEENNAGSSEGTVVEATQVNYPPVDASTLSSAREPKCDDDGGGGGRGCVATDVDLDVHADRRRLGFRESRSSSSDPLVSPVRSSSAPIGLDDDADAMAYDAETVGPNDDEVRDGQGVIRTAIGVGGIGPEQVEAIVADHQSPAGEIDGARDRREMAYDCVGVATDGVGLDDRREDDVGGRDDGSRAMMMKDPFHATTNGGACAEWKDDGSLVNEERRGSVDNGLSSETEPRGNVGIRGSNGTGRVSNFHEKSLVVVDACLKDTPNARGETALSDPDRDDDKGNAEFTLTTSDIKDIIAAVGVAREMADQADPGLDPFAGIDIERWQSLLVGFEGFVAALGDPCTTEAIELRLVNECERAYAILHRGMGVNHCNAVFMHDMIRMIGHGINVGRDGHSHLGHGGLNKLDNLAACVNAIFGVNDDCDDAGSPTMAVSVSVSTTGDDRTTILKFSKSLEPSNEVNDTPSSTSATLPPHLHAMSQVFECFASEMTRLLRLQVNSTRETLAATREGAMYLQRRALELQDEVQVAKNIADEAVSRQRRAEAEIARLRYDFERRAESFERVKEHYHAELTKLKQGYEREHRELKVESSKAKSAHIEHLGTGTRKRKEMSDRRDDYQMSGGDIEYHTRHSTLHPTRDATLCVEISDAVDEQISPSIPRNIEYGATDTFESDHEESRRKIRRSMHSSESATLRNSRSEPVELKIPRRHQTSLKSTMIGTSRKTERHQVAISESNKRNPLESVIKCSRQDSNDFSSSENRELGNIHELSSMKYHTPHEERNDWKEGRLISNAVSSTKKINVTENPSIKPAKNATKCIDSDNEPPFAYQEVVRGRANRQALPGHECEKCRKWFDAIGPGYDRREIVKECSRHRSRHIPPSTPPDFWKLTFVDE
ncbi:hypothetical protein ACHAXA_011400 [Cyclostephanos tholiformis]|uniref:DNA endonuclease activator Ctp1 C-terminal domain-containing protein n=1 Tax=Cyclostephanos tholiformis TaxID=382380 RepID=A0ABD3RAH0_9STRA